MKAMKKEYWISRAILCVLALIVFFIAIINEDESFNIVPFIFTGVVFALSFISEIFSRLLIKLGDRKTKMGWKLLCYLVIPVGIMVLLMSVLWLIAWIEGEISRKMDIEYDSMGDVMSYALVYLLIMISAFIGIILPYLQTLIVLPLRRIMNKSN